MKAQFAVENPKEIEATMKITMSIEDWEKLEEQLQAKWPSSRLSEIITDLLRQARKVFYTLHDDGI